MQQITEDAQRYSRKASALRETFSVRRPHSDIVGCAIGLYAVLHQGHDEVPHALIPQSSNPFDAARRIEDMMRRPSYQTINFTDPDGVELFATLFNNEPLHKYGCISTHATAPQDDIRILLRFIVGEEYTMYRDLARLYQAFHREIPTLLQQQFGAATTKAVLKNRPTLARLLEQSAAIARQETFTQEDHDAMSVQTRQRLSVITSDEEGARVLDEIIRGNAKMQRYRELQHELRGIPYE